MADTASFEDMVGAPLAEWDQGDIVSGVYFGALDTHMPAVLVTPGCDIEQGKVGFWTFVALYPDQQVARAIADVELRQWGTPAAYSDLSKGQQRELLKLMRNLVNQRYPRYHWVPASIGPARAHVADFACVTSLPVEEVKANATRHWSLRSSWKEQLPARYASFMARVATLDMSEDDCASASERLALGLF